MGNGTDGEGVVGMLGACLAFSKSMVSARKKSIQCVDRNKERKSIAIIKEVGEVLKASNLSNKITNYGKENQNN